MPIISGRLLDFGDFTMGVGAEVVLTPSENGVIGSNVLTTRPIVATPSENGNFSMSVRPTKRARPALYYKPSLRWLTPGDPGGGYTSVDYPDWQVHVGDEDANFADLVETKGTHNPLIVYVSPSEPPFQPPNLFWLNTSGGGTKLYGKAD
jgi:hypothetical protein